MGSLVFLLSPSSKRRFGVFATARGNRGAKRQHRIRRRSTIQSGQETTIIAIPLLAVLLLGAPQDSSAPVSAPPTNVAPTRHLTPEQEELIKQKVEEAKIRHEPVRREAMRINDLASNIHSGADARKLVDAVAEVLTNHRHLFWAAQGFRHRVAHAEYEGVSDKSGLIPEQRIVDVWNDYVREIDAPEDALVTVADVHNFRLTDIKFARREWDLDMTRTIWSMPNIYALDAEGNFLDGCRALEALRLISRLHDQFFRVQFARRSLQKLAVPSSVVDQPQDSGLVTLKVIPGRILGGGVVQDPINPAARRYQQEHGERAYDQMVRRLFNQLLPAE